MPAPPIVTIPKYLGAVRTMHAVSVPDMARALRVNASVVRRWLRGTEFHYPERPENLPSLKPLENWPKFNPRDLR